MKLQTTHPCRTHRHWLKSWVVLALVALVALSGSCWASSDLPVLLAGERPLPVNDEAPVRVLLKFVKAQGPKPAPPVVFDATSCAACRLMNDANFDRDNARETLVGLWVPRRRYLDLRFTQAPGSVKRVLLQTGDMPFRAQGTQLTVSLPPVWHDAVSAAELSTHLVEPGMVMRIEHADELRRAGQYAGGVFPMRQRRAADQLQFAMREFVRSSGLGRHVADERLGAIMLMGFDTNLPFGHVDFPPHVHMHLRWPQAAGTQIAHFYIDEDGLLVDNVVGFRHVGAPSRTFRRGETFTTFDVHGRPIYSHTVTPQGWLKLGRAGQAPCELRPLAGGFDSGVTLDCPDRPAVIIQVVSDLSAGVIRVQTGAVEEVLRIDPDTGWLLSGTRPPPPPPSAYVPPAY